MVLDQARVGECGSLSYYIHVVTNELWFRVNTRATNLSAMLFSSKIEIKEIRNEVYVSATIT